METREQLKRDKAALAAAERAKQDASSKGNTATSALSKPRQNAALMGALHSIEAGKQNKKNDKGKNGTTPKSNPNTPPFSPGKRGGGGKQNAK